VEPPGRAAGTPEAANPHRWRALALLCGMQIMVLLDVTAVNVALPSIRADLGFSEAGLAWVVDGYVLMAGGLLILGGRLADHLGRRRMLLAGVLLFAVSSAVAGAATDRWLLVAGRFGQGTADALAGPAALGLIALMFSDPAERTRALGIWGGLLALAGILGYLVSGLLVQLASWRWLFLVNLPVAALTLWLLPRLVPESRMVRAAGQSLDLPGAAALTAGLVTLVLGLLRAAEQPLSSPAVAIPLTCGAVLLLAAVSLERRARFPLVPPDFLSDRTRSTVNVASLLFMASFISYTFLLTLYLQDVLRFPPLQGGLAWIPLGLSIGAGIAAATSAVPRAGVRAVTAVGFAGAGLGLFLASALRPDGSYLTGVLPGMVVFGFFAGATMPAATSAALHRVTVQDSSLASGVQSTMQQVGAALGLATLVTLAVRRAGEAAAGLSAEAAATEGYALAFRVGGALLLLGSAMVLAFFEKVDPVVRDPAAEAARGIP
jgi:EmrB/QacA subfamily drug resistance transporter